MTRWRTTHIDKTPTVELIDWAVYEVQLAGRVAPTQHLVGCRRQNPFGKVSSAIVEVDPSQKRVLTESGQIYVLQGGYSLLRNTDGVWRQWLSIYDLSTYADITEEFTGLLNPHPGQVPP